MVLGNLSWLIFVALACNFEGGESLHPRHYIDARALGEIKSSYSGQRCSPGPAVIGGRSCFGGVMRRSLYVPKAWNGRSPVPG